MVQSVTRWILIGFVCWRLSVVAVFQDYGRPKICRVHVYLPCVIPLRSCALHVVPLPAVEQAVLWAREGGCPQISTQRGET